MKRTIGAVGMILGVLCLSLEVYGLRILQALDRAHGEWYTSAWRYAGEPTSAAALILTAAVVLFSAVLFFAGKDE